MKRLLAIIISVLMVILSAGIVFAAPEGESESEGGESEEAMATGALLGGWTVDEDAAEAELPEEVKAAFDKALEGYVGMNFTPIAYLGSQVVAGTNYMILCKGAPVVLDPQTGLYVVIIYADLEGNATITNVADFDLAKIEESEPEEAAEEGTSDASALLAGGWTAADAPQAAELPEDAAAAFNAATESLLGVDYVPVTLLGTKVIAGTEYAFLVHATIVSSQPTSDYAVMFAAANADGTYDVMDIVALNLADFNDTVIDEEAEAPAESVGESVEGESAEGESADSEAAPADGAAPADAAPAAGAAPAAEDENVAEFDVTHPIAGDIHIIVTYERGEDGEITITSMVDPELGEDILFVTADDFVASVADMIE